MAPFKIPSAHIYLFVVAAIYGLNYTVAKGVMPEFIAPAPFVFVRIAVACAMFWFLGLFYNDQHIDRKDLLRLAACGLFGAALNMTLFFQGLSITSPINASIIMTVNPILVLISSYFLLHEKLTLTKWTGIALGLTGAVGLIVANASAGISSGNAFGDFLVFVNASSYAIYLVIVKPLMRKYLGITVIKWVFLFGVIWTLPIAFLMLGEVNWTAFTTQAWLGLGYVIVGTTFFTYLLNIIALKTVNPSVVSVYIYLQPMLATVAAVALGKDSLYAIKLASMAVIFSGVYLVSRANKTAVLAK